ncbi:MAG: Chemotaxis response regulator protein-glutamate methylesterase [Bacteroidota bacterium]
MACDFIVIGGSAGSFQTIVGIVNSLPKNFSPSIILCLHRLKHVRSGFVEALSIKTKIPIVEPTDKMKIERGTVYLAPANYHLMIDAGERFSLATSKAVNHSRPSIDLTMRSAAFYLSGNVIGIILSGANRDGAIGLKAMFNKGAHTVIQSPADAQVSAMPLAALSLFEPNQQLSKDEIIDLILKSNNT